MGCPWRGSRCRRWSPDASRPPRAHAVSHGPGPPRIGGSPLVRYGGVNAWWAVRAGSLTPTSPRSGWGRQVVRRRLRDLGEGPRKLPMPTEPTEVRAGAAVGVLRPGAGSRRFLWPSVGRAARTRHGRSQGPHRWDVSLDLHQDLPPRGGCAAVAPLTSKNGYRLASTSRSQRVTVHHPERLWSRVQIPCHHP